MIITLEPTASDYLNVYLNDVLIQTRITLVPGEIIHLPVEGRILEWVLNHENQGG